MPYTPTVWQDRIVEKPRTYTLTNNPDGTVTLTPAPGTVVQEGTPVNAIRLNNLEGIYSGVKDELADNAGELWDQIRIADGAGSGLDADFVRGINVVEDVRELDYNVYQLILQNYYDGKAIYKKGLFFDGFQDENMSDPDATTKLIIDVASKKISLDSFLKILIEQLDIGSFVPDIGGYADMAKLCQTFKATADNVITSVTLRLYRKGSPNDYVKCSIYTISDGVPDTELGSDTVKASDISDSAAQDHTFSFGEIQLEAGVSYAIVLERTGAIDSSNRIQTYGETTDKYADGQYGAYNSNTSTWTLNASRDLYFKIEGYYAKYLDAVYQTKEQAFENNVDNAYLYIRFQSAVSGVTITPQIAVYTGTASFADMIFVSSRSLGDGYQEYKYKYEGAGGNKVKLKLNLSRTTTDKILEIMDYGVLLGVV
jgi:hypothetical protein